MPTSVTLLIALGVLLVTPGLPVAADEDRASRDPHAIADLAWMAGCWAATDEAGGRTEECWTAPAGGLMLGLHREVRSGKPAWFEYLRIQQGRDGNAPTVVYWASPGGGEATAFALVSARDQRAVFENAEHDFPQRIIYHRTGDTLRVRAEGQLNGGERTMAWTWTRTAFPDAVD